LTTDKLEMLVTVTFSTSLGLRN